MSLCVRVQTKKRKKGMEVIGKCHKSSRVKSLQSPNHLEECALKCKTVDILMCMCISF